MADTKTPKTRIRVANAREYRKPKFGYVAVEDGTHFKIRRLDLPTMFFEGFIPTPLFGAVDKFQQIRKKFEDDSIADAVELFTPDVKNSVKELLRRIAVATSVEPTLTHSRRESLANPDVLWVGGISDVPGDLQIETAGDVTLETLTRLYRAVLGEAGVRFMTDEEAAEFRADEPTTHVAPISHGADVRTEAVVMDPSATIVHHGERDIEVRHH